MKTIKEKKNKSSTIEPVTTPETTPPPAMEQKVPVYVQVREGSESRIRASGDQVVQSIIDDLVTAEVANRKAHLKKALDARIILESAMKKHRPDIQTFDETGKVISEGWSKRAVDAKNQDASKLKNLDSAIDKAVENNEWENLVKVINSLGNNNAKPE